MDLSKLPRMSETPAPPPPAQSTPLPQAPMPQVYFDPAPSVAAEAWISIAIGLILLLVSPYTLQWLISLISSYKPPFLPITSTDFQTGAVTEVPYPSSVFFFSHLCVFAFALAMIISGLILFTRKTLLVGLAFAFTLIATLMNLIYVVKATMTGEALPIISALAVAFGGYLAFSQYRLLQVLRLLEPPAPRRVD
jgi:hypothetical protein